MWSDFDFFWLGPLIMSGLFLYVLIHVLAAIKIKERQRKDGGFE